MSEAPLTSDRKHAPVMPSRRKFLSGMQGVALAAAGSVLVDADLLVEASAQETELSRNERAYRRRVEAALRERELRDPYPANNADEKRYPNRIASYSKALPHNHLGEVDPVAYQSMLNALMSGRPADFETIILGGTTKLTNPQSGLAFEMQGADSHALAQPPAPRFDSTESASEMGENYWMALSRDVPFSEYEVTEVTRSASMEMSRFSNFKGPKVLGQVTPGTLFRGTLPGDTVGPYVSQFLWLDTPFGAEHVERRMRTAVPGLNYMTNYAEWLAIQNGGAAGPVALDSTPRYIRNGRDLGQWVHVDVLFQAYFNALLILFDLRAPFDAGNPYNHSRTQIGFGTLGEPYIANIVCAVARQALKSVWYQKWFVHRRLRPEAFGGRIHNHMTGAAKYPISKEILSAEALRRTAATYGTYLLPMAFPEGSPTHPSYGAGHATVAGACVTVLKALFDESFVIPNPVQAERDGLSLVPYSGPPLTVGGELNKLASNISLGRNFAGVHWRSDATESLKLGEEVAIRYMREERVCFNENYPGFSLTKFDGTTITI